MRPTAELPDDPALPAIAAIRKAGLDAIVSALDLRGHPVELRLCGYTAGARATLEARAGDRRFAVKIYADDPTPEAELYQAFAAAAAAGESGARVPRLLAWERELRILVISWLDGVPTNQLIKSGHGERAGELAAAWLWHTVSLSVTLGPPLGAGHMLYQIGRSVAELRAADRALGVSAKRVASLLARTQPMDPVPRLVHGTLYARHILDAGGGPGVIDWERHGQGPIELDAGTFLATIARLRLRHEAAAAEAARAEQLFRARTRGLFDEAALTWYQAAALLFLGSRQLKRKSPAEARALISEASRIAERAGAAAPVPRVSSAPRRSALELVLAALSSTPATAEELDQIRKLLDEYKGRTAS